MTDWLFISRSIRDFVFITVELISTLISLTIIGCWAHLVCSAVQFCCLARLRCQPEGKDVCQNVGVTWMAISMSVHGWAKYNLDKLFLDCVLAVSMLCRTYGLSDWTRTIWFNLSLQGDPYPGKPRLGWLWFGMFHHLTQLLSQFCQFPISPGRTRQRVEQPKSKSMGHPCIISSYWRNFQFDVNKLYYVTRWTTMYF